LPLRGHLLNETALLSDAHLALSEALSRELGQRQAELRAERGLGSGSRQMPLSSGLYPEEAESMAGNKVLQTAEWVDRKR
jgi:hypothetical protein